VFKFAVISGTGWLIDFAIFVLLTGTGLSPFLANVAGAGTAVTFVFFASVRKVFEYQGGYLVGKLVLYLCFQVVAVNLASLAIQLLVSHPLIPPLSAKILVTPITFYLNFQFMAYLTSGRLRLY
jgi:putative flippase GtrA